MDSTKQTPGYVYTFYSYKGGVGRSMALANVAALLTKWGSKVLIVDWDLEAPGLEIFFQQANLLRKGREYTPGVVDLLEASATPGSLDWRDCLLEVPIDGNALHIMSAGKKDDTYQSRVQNLDWAKLFSQNRIGNTINQMRGEWKDEYDFVLIDSRTGITDIGDICTVLLPDALVLLFVSNYQNICGVRDLMTRARAAHKALPVNRGRLVGVPIPARDEVYTEYDKSQSWKAIFAEELGELYKAWLPRDVSPRTALNKLFIPYVTNWSFGERLPVVENPAEIENPASISAAYARLATLLANGLDWYSLEKSADPYELLAARAEKEAALKQVAVLEAAAVRDSTVATTVRAKKRPWVVQTFITTIIIISLLAISVLSYRLSCSEIIVDVTREDLQKLLDEPERPEQAIAKTLAAGVQQKQDFTGVDLSGVALRDVNLSDGRFNGANFTETKLVGASLIGAYLNGASLTGADLKEARLIGSNLVGADLRGADLRGADLTGASLTDARFDQETKFPEGFIPEERGMIGPPPPEPEPIEQREPEPPEQRELEPQKQREQRIDDRKNREVETVRTIELGASRKLERDQVFKVIDSNRDKIEKCYKQALAANRYLKGSMLVRVTILANGKIANASAVRNELSEGIEKCIVSVLRRTTFPKSDGKATFDLPFNLNPDDSPTRQLDKKGSREQAVKEEAPGEEAAY